jgi:hypothetical protein
MNVLVAPLIRGVARRAGGFKVRETQFCEKEPPARVARSPLVRGAAEEKR